jgi:glucose-6-phosphate isomerase
MFKGLLFEKYGAEEGSKRITAVTDANRGVLHDMAVKEGWERFVVPDDVGGRFSVLSAVGLLPMAVAGIDVEKVIACAEAEFKAMDLRSPENPAWQYAAARQHLYANGKGIEILAAYEPSFRFFAEWWKQLYGESEGKDGIGIYPASVEFTADLHSMGQYIQEGVRNLYETVVMFDEDLFSFEVPHEVGDPDGLNYLAGRQLGDIMRTAAKAVMQAHIDGGVPNIVVSVPKRDEAGFAALVVFFELACGLSGYVSGVSKAERMLQWQQELDARRVIVVGDRRTDISNAREAGAYAIGVTYGMGSREELSGADALCDTAMDVARECLRVIEQG